MQPSNLFKLIIYKANKLCLKIVNIKTPGNAN